MTTRSGKLYQNNTAKERIKHSCVSKYIQSKYRQRPKPIKGQLMKRDVGVNNIWFMCDENLLANRINYHYWSPTFQSVVDKFPNPGGDALKEIKNLFSKAKPKLTDLSWIEYYF